MDTTTRKNLIAGGSLVVASLLAAAVGLFGSEAWVFAGGALATFWLNASYYPQIYKLWVTGKARDIDLSRYWIACVALMFITGYAWRETGNVLYIASSAWGVSNMGIMVALKLRAERLYSFKAPIDQRAEEYHQSLVEFVDRVAISTRGSVGYDIRQRAIELKSRSTEGAGAVAPTDTLAPGDAEPGRRETQV